MHKSLLAIVAAGTLISICTGSLQAQNSFFPSRLSLSEAYAAPADEASGDQVFRGKVFFRGGITFLFENRGGEVFTDTLATDGENDDDTGFGVAAGLDLDLGHEFMAGNLLGEIFVEYAEHSRKDVRQTTSALLAGSNNEDVTVSQLSVVIAPKLAWTFDSIHPWIIPVGLGFLVNSPPSNNSGYLDIGLHFGAGVDVDIAGPLSLGIDVRYTEALGQVDTELDYLSVGINAGVAF